MIISRSRDPQGQKVTWSYHFNTSEKMANLESLSNSLSNDTNFEKIGPVVFDTW